MTRLTLTVVTLVGAEYVTFDGEFPHGDFREGETPAAAARRVVETATGTREPKLEILDFVASGDEMRFVFRALLTSDPVGATKRYPRMGLPETIGRLKARDLEEMQKTSLNYKLTRA